MNNPLKYLIKFKLAAGFREQLKVWVKRLALLMQKTLLKLEKRVKEIQKIRKVKTNAFRLNIQNTEICNGNNSNQ